MYYIVGIILVLILSVFVVLIGCNRYVETNFMKGFWKGGPDFCREAELDMCLIYIGDSTMWSSKRSGYILMKNEEGLIINNPVEFIFYGGTSIKPGTTACREYTVKINWLDEEEPEFFPSEQELYYYPELGKIVLVANDETTAVVYKDNITTDVSNKMPDSCTILESTSEEI